MSLPAFLGRLFTSGSVEIAIPFPSDDELENQRLEAVETLSGRAAEIAETLPPPTPDADLGVAFSAAKALYLATYTYVHRETETDPLGLVQIAPAHEPATPETHFGADLALSFAPMLLTMTKATASADPLVTAIVDLLRPWPLSSVGVPEAAPDPDCSLPFFTHPALRALYIDRIIASDDTSRLAHPEVREAVAAALGAHRDLAPDLAKVIDA